MAVFCAIAQDAPAGSNHKSPGIGWFLSPEYSALFHTDHLGHALGFQAGVQLLNGHLKAGLFYYGEVAQNPYTVEAMLPSGVSYKGKNSLSLGADHGAFGLMLAPVIRLPNSGIALDFPVYYGSLGAGFYLQGEDRITPDNRRVSKWENELFEGRDAAFAGLFEVGVRALMPTNLKGMQWGVGLHYTTVQGWETFVDPSGDFYNNKFRASLFVNFGTPYYTKRL